MVHTPISRTCDSEIPHSTVFGYLSDEERKMLDARTVILQYKKGEVIAKQGSFASHVIYLIEGLVKIYLEGNSKDLILKIVPSEHLITLPTVFEGNNTFVYSVASYTESTVKLFDAELFKQLLRINSRFAARIISILNENTAQDYNRFYSLTRKQAHGRLAEILLCLSQRIYRNGQFDLSLSRSDLADLTGLSSESVIRILKEFREEGLIDIHGKALRILNIPSLEKISLYG